MTVFIALLSVLFILVFNVAVATEQAEKSRQKWDNWEELEVGYRNY